MQPVDVRTASILIVADRTADVLLLEQLLQEAGYSCVVTADKPEEAAPPQGQASFDLVLLDLQLPADGLKVLHALQSSIHGWPSVIVLTAEQSQRLRVLEGGAKDVIGKPRELVEVTIRVHNVLEARLLYRELEACTREFELRVEARTAELSASAARFRGLIELAADWYWEQDADGAFTTVSGPVLELLGMQLNSLAAAPKPAVNGWNVVQRAELLAKIAAREPFLDHDFSRRLPDGSRQSFRVSGQPLFDLACNFIGYRGVGVEIASKETDARHENSTHQPAT